MNAFITKLLKLSLISAAALLFACSSSSDSGGSNLPASQTRNISGAVLPAVSSAQVELRMADGSIAVICGSEGGMVCRVWTDENGKFTFSTYSNIDLAGLSVVSYGGYDEEYKRSLDGLSFSAPLSIFASDYSGVVVSPVTSLVNILINNDMGKNQAEAAVRSALELDGNISLAASPLEDTQILKSSYVIVKIAQIQKNTQTLEPMADIALAVKKHIGSAIYSDAVLNEAGFTQAQKDDVAEVAANIKAITGDVSAVIAGIAQADRRTVFKRALTSALGNPTGMTDEYSESSAALLSWVEALAEGALPLEEIIITQVAAYLVNMDTLFSNPSNYLSADAFRSSLAAYTISGIGKADLKYISKEAIIRSNLPLAAPLGDDNVKRVSYFYNSDADFNVKARDYIAEVYEDGAIDEIYSNIAASYARMGLYQKAANLADAYLASSFVRADTYMDISRLSAPYSETVAEFYADKAKAVVDALYEQSNATKIITEKYMSMVAIYQTAGKAGSASAYTKATALRSWVIDTYLEGIPVGHTPDKFTLHATLISSVQNEIIPPQLTAGEYAEAIDSIKLFVSLINGLGPNISLPNPYAGQLTYYRNALEYCEYIAEKKPELIEEVKVIALDAWERSKTLIELTNSGYTGRSYLYQFLPYIAGPIYTFKGLDAVKSEILAIYTPEMIEDGVSIYEDYEIKLLVRDLAANAMSRLALDEGFEKAAAFFEEAAGFYCDGGGNNCSMWTADNEYRDITGFDIDNFAYYEDSSIAQAFSSKLAAYAYERGDVALAKKALDYVAPLVDMVFEHYNNNVFHTTENPGGTLVVDDVPYALYGYQRHSQYTGYMALAEMYALIGETAKVTEILTKLESFADTHFFEEAWFFDDSDIEMYYAMMGGIYSLAGDITEANRLFGKAYAAAAIVSGAEARYKNYIMQALEDTIPYRKDLALAKTQLESALAAARDIAAVGGIDTTIKKEVEKLSDLARYYTGIDAGSEAQPLLEEAETLAQTILSSTTKTEAINYVLDMYAALKFYDLAHSKVSLISAPADRYTAIRSIAATITKRNDFPGCDAAFVDYDGDGKPDFFAPSAKPEQISACGLTLDDDIDGDSKPETTDLTPYYAD
jgi:hypothetical protein